MAEKKTDAEHPKVAAVRKAAGTLATAIADAHAAGFAVALPSKAEDVGSIVVSETGRAGIEEEATLAGTPVQTVTDDR